MIQDQDLEKIYEDTEPYRNRLATVTQEGRRVWVFPKKPIGRYYNLRSILSFFLIAFLFTAPFIKVNGDPILLLNFLERKFIIFGLKFWPQDMHLFALSLVTFIVFVVLFTVVFGRLFCGWVCPQTVFMEMLFRKIEYWIEGDANKQRQLSKAPWSSEKIIKKTSKHFVFYALSFFIGNIFLSYIIGSDRLLEIITDNPAHHIQGLSAMIIFSAVFYGVFAFMREQVCCFVCPYGRLQSVLLDKNSIAVSYDFNRGEPRGLKKKDSEQAYGDCIDCGYCVQVCPTGIDIRNGTQLECVNCTACMDACDTVMKKLKRPAGLVRYDSYNSIQSGTRKIWTPRVIGYCLVLTLLLSSLVFLFANRLPIETTILRTPGMLFQKLPNGVIQNIYNIKVVNKTSKHQLITVKLSEPKSGEVTFVTGKTLNAKANQLAESALFVKIPQATKENIPITIEVYGNDQLIETIKTNFKAPKP